MVTDFPLPVFLVVLLAALFHAAWNALIRGGEDPLLHTAAFVFWAAVVAAPFLLVVTPPAVRSWPYLALSNTIHMAYYVSLAAAYRRGTLSFAYPLIRGSAPLLVALGSIIVIGEAPSWLGWFGILLVSAGVLGIALRAEHPNPLPTLGWALLCAFTIAVYTLADGLGVRQAHSAAGYSVWMYLLEGVLFLGGITLFGRGKELVSYVHKHWRTGLLGGTLSAAAYAIALWAMTQAPVALVAATRETSVLFASLLGVWALRERFSLRQWAGAVAIAGGALLLRSGAVVAVH
jgi:drug/metabolite transporter (DMT)-like permease